MRPSYFRFSDIVIAAFMAVSILFLFYSFNFHGIIKFSAKFIFLFYVIPVISVAVGLVALLACPRSWKAAIATSLICAGATVFLAEIYLAMRFDPVLTTERTTTATSRASTFDVVARLRAGGNYVYPAVTPYKLLHTPQSGPQPDARIAGRPVLPLSGVANVTTVFCDEGYGMVIYNSDRFGFRNSDDVWNHDRADLAVIGDSYVQGACVHDGEDFVSLLRKRWRGTLNLGMAGNGPLLNLAILKEYAAHQRPRLVLWIYTENNDLSNLEDERKIPSLMDYLDAEHVIGLKRHQSSVDAALRKFLDELYLGQKKARDTAKEVPPPQDTRNEEKRDAPKARDNPLSRIKSVLLLQNLRARLGLYHLRLDPDLLALLDRILKEADRTVKSWGGKLVFAPMPSTARYFGPAVNLGYPRAQSAFTMAFVERLGIPTIDIYSVFDKVDDLPSLFPPHRHMSSQGYRVFAETLARDLQKYLRPTP